MKLINATILTGKILAGTILAFLVYSPTMVAGTLFGGAPVPGTFTEGLPFGGLVATLHDSDPNEPVSNLFATINWGDATFSNGIVISQGPGLFGVIGNHSYAEQGTYSLTVNASNLGGAFLAIPGTGLVLDAPLSNGPTGPLAGTEGASVNATLATFTDLNPSATASDFTSTIDWGDGTVATAGIVSGNAGQFLISGSHVYAEEGHYTYTVHTLDAGGSTTLANGQAQIADAPVLAISNFPPLVFQGLPMAFPAATLFDQNPNGLASDFTASINWGDGTPVSSGTIVAAGGGQFLVLGQHTYSATGRFLPLVSVTDDGGSFAPAPGLVNVVPVPGAPEPAPLPMIGGGLAVLAWARGRRK